MTTIRVADFEGSNNDTEVHKVKDVLLRLSTFALHDSLEATDTSESARTGDRDDCTQDGEALRILALPSSTLVGTWEGLVFDDGVHSRILRFTSGMSALPVPLLTLAQTD